MNSKIKTKQMKKENNSGLPKWKIRLLAYHRRALKKSWKNEDGVPLRQHFLNLINTLEGLPKKKYLKDMINDMNDKQLIEMKEYVLKLHDINTMLLDFTKNIL
jgi:hypothetical protein